MKKYRWNKKKFAKNVCKGLVLIALACIVCKGIAWGLNAEMEMSGKSTQSFLSERGGK